MLCPTDKHLSLCDKEGKEIHRKRRRFGNKFYSEGTVHARCSSDQRILKKTLMELISLTR